MKNIKKKMYSKGLSECPYMDGRDLFGGERNLTGKSYLFNRYTFHPTYAESRFLHTNLSIVGLKKIGDFQLACDLPRHAVLFLQKYRKGKKGLSRLFKDGKPIMEDGKPITEDGKYTIEENSRASEDWFVLEYAHKGKTMVILFGYSSLNGWLVYDLFPAESMSTLFLCSNKFIPNTDIWHAEELMMTRMLEGYLPIAMGQ